MMENMGIRLSNSGFFTEDAIINQATDLTWLEKRVLFVYEGTFQSADGEVTVTKAHLNSIVKNHNSVLARVKRLATGELPVHKCQPLQLDHSSSALVTVGRIYGPLEIAEVDVDGEGTMKTAILGTVRVLGKENVEKVLDGRWCHVSIGADLHSVHGKLNELSITPFPAAANAHMLKGAQTEQTDKAKETAMLEKLKAYLTRKKKLSDSEADEKLKKLSEDEQKALAAEADDDEKKEAEAKRLADEEAAKKLAEEEDKKAAETKAKMAAKKSEAVKLMKAYDKEKANLKAEIKKTQITARLARLKAEAKITPAEIKKLDIAKLSTQSDGEVEAMFEGYAKREPVILSGVMGSAQGVNIADLARKAKLTATAESLEAEIRAQFNSNPANVKLTAEAEKSRKAALAVVPSDEGSEVPGVKPHDHLKRMKHLNKLLSEGKNDEAKEFTAKCLSDDVDDDKLSAYEDGEAEKHLAALASSLEKIETEYKAFVKLSSEALGITEADLGE